MLKIFVVQRKEKKLKTPSRVGPSDERVVAWDAYVAIVLKRMFRSLYLGANEFNTRVVNFVVMFVDFIRKQILCKWL